MLTRLVIRLEEHEREALRLLAEHELRDIRVQASLIIRQELARRGLIKADVNAKKTGNDRL